LFNVLFSWVNRISSSFCYNLSIITILYSIGRYIAKRLVRKTKCVLYINNLKNLNTTTNETSADLVIAKSRGYLTHLDSNLFNILKSLEISFADELNVFDKTCEDFFKKNIYITFPCV